MVRKYSRIPSLDGLRAVSILLVIIGHAFHFRIIDIANLGVRMFFIISSYLIFGILSREIEMKRFSVTEFYFKRIMRTFPAFYFYLLIVLLLLLHLNMFDWEQFWRAPIYLENYHPRGSWNSVQWFVGHTWSLAVEEQFYILVAFLFLLVDKRHITQNKLALILIAIIVVIPSIRVSYLFSNFIPDVFTGSINRSFETVSDSLAIGGLLLLTKEKIEGHKLIIFFKNKIFLLIIIILTIQFLNSSYLVSILGLKIRYAYNFFGISIMNFSMGLIMLILINYPKRSFASRLLNSKVLITIGLWSYSIYLWQQVWLYSWDLSIYFKLLGILICVLLSYYFVELPFLRLRDNYLKKLRSC